MLALAACASTSLCSQAGRGLGLHLRRRGAPPRLRGSAIDLPGAGLRIGDRTLLLYVIELEKSKIEWQVAAIERRKFIQRKQ